MMSNTDDTFLTISNLKNDICEKTDGTAATYVFPSGWVFDPAGNSLLKKRKKTVKNATQKQKNTDWFAFVCNDLGIKIPRENKIKLLTELNQTNNFQKVEEQLIIIWKKKNESQK